MAVSEEAMTGEVCNARVRQLPATHNLRASVWGLRTTQKLRARGAKGARFGKRNGRGQKVPWIVAANVRWVYDRAGASQTRVPKILG
jgi:hypothetical protein